MEKTLEDRLFKNILKAGIITVSLLILYDFFYTQDYHSVLIELAAGGVFLYYLLTSRNQPLTKGHRYLFCLLLFAFVNLGWISGSGINLLNASLLFLVMAMFLILNSKKLYIYIFILFAVNLTVLFLLQYYSDIWIGKKYATEKQFLINDYLTACIFYILGGYIIYFLKSSYDRERNKLHESNSLLLEKSVEVSYQNEELKMSKDVLDHMVGQLEEQTKELTDIKRTLEDKVNDRTDDLRKLNERLIGQNQQLEQYAYITSHNLRSPIAQIKGLVSLLPEDNHFDPTTREAINRIKSSTEHLEKVFGDLSEIIKVEKSMQQPWQEVDLIAEMDSVISSLKTSIEEKHIDIVKPVQQKLLVTALRPYVYSVLHNIIENAVKYSDDNKDRRYIKVELQDAHKFHHVAITDNGIGIDMELASGKVFKMYQRFNNTHPGQGFGLFLVKSQMEAMEGTVEVESILGQGTTFNLYFPKR